MLRGRTAVTVRSIWPIESAYVFDVCSVYTQATIYTNIYVRHAWLWEGRKMDERKKKVFIFEKKKNVDTHENEKLKTEYALVRNRETKHHVEWKWNEYCVRYVCVCVCVLYI